VPPFVYVHIETKNKISGCAVYAEPDGITLSEMPASVTKSLFDGILLDIREPSRIHGPTEPANQLALYYAESTKSSPVLHSEWNVYRLDEPPTQCRSTDGAVRLANQTHVDIVAAWGKMYDAEKPANVDIEKFLRRKLKDGLLFFWVDQEPKALLTLSGVDCSGNRISSVFTPKQYRGKGYATSLVYETSVNLLAAGKAFITLNTEIGDPAEHIYEKLGYKIVGKRVSFVFDPVAHK
jgi:GNAT superfamily N-acetyltransferase